MWEAAWIAAQQSATLTGRNKAYQDANAAVCCGVFQLHSKASVLQLEQDRKPIYYHRYRSVMYTLEMHRLVVAVSLNRNVCLYQRFLSI
jgi:hypothetical protein